VSTTISFITRNLVVAFISVCALTSLAFGQKPEQKQASDQTDVVRINTELVQTDVTVFDKQGRFVDGLQREQFELRVDGKPQPISFFERVGLGRPGQEKPAPSETGEPRASSIEKAADRRGARGRLIFFFVDDAHLSADTLIRARQAILQFVNTDMRQDDLVAVVSTSGKVGFLQQLTANKAVLREAISRLDFRQNLEVYAGKVPISEYEATQVTANRNRDLFAYLVEATAKEYQMDAASAARLVRHRARQISIQSRMASSDTLSVLESLMRSSAPLVGRKIVFFISDGFVAEPRASSLLDRLRQIAKAAAQVGAVIHTLDARGMYTTAFVDATTKGYPDFSGRMARNPLGETTATQQPLRTLAEDTGGQTILSSNSLNDGFRRALKDSSDYYLLAWRPELVEQAGARARVTVSIKDRSELKVRVRRGVIEPPKISSANERGANVSSPDEALLATLGSLYPVRALPVSLSAGYVNTPTNGMVLTVSMQLETAGLRDEAANETQAAEVEVLGVALDDRGSISSFKQKLTITRESLSTVGRDYVVWNQQLPLPPGLYQVRVAVRERASGRTGSAMQWIEIPGITPESFSLSSIFIGETRVVETTTSPKIPVSVNHRFARNSRLRYQTYIYHAARGTVAPDITFQVQILRDGRPVLTMSQLKPTINEGTDLARIPFSGELALEQLPAGRYVLQITATDRLTKMSASQQAELIVE
jgi:VWFA-related protein